MHEWCAVSIVSPSFRRLNGGYRHVLEQLNLYIVGLALEILFKPGEHSRSASCRLKVHPPPPSPTLFIPAMASSHSRLMKRTLVHLKCSNLSSQNGGCSKIINSMYVAATYECRTEKIRRGSTGEGEERGGARLCLGLKWRGGEAGRRC